MAVSKNSATTGEIENSVKVNKEDVESSNTNDSTNLQIMSMIAQMQQELLNLKQENENLKKEREDTQTSIPQRLSEDEDITIINK